MRDDRANLTVAMNKLLRTDPDAVIKMFGTAPDPHPPEPGEPGVMPPITEPEPEDDDENDEEPEAA